MEERNPGQLMDAGETTLPCGFSLAEPFRLRFRHYQTCEHPYCRERRQVANKMGVELARDIRANARKK